MVTQWMLTEAARAGGYDTLTIWARRVVRVTSADPLHASARGGSTAVARLLVQRMGANVSHASYGVTPLMVAARNANPAMVHCLVQLGADVNEATSHGITPLMLAALSDDPAVTQCLRELRAEVGAVDNYGNTALLKSACRGHYLMMRYLPGGANIEDVNNDGNTVWDLLIEYLDEVPDDDSDSDADDRDVEMDLMALISLLRVMVLCAGPPSRAGGPTVAQARACGAGGGTTAGAAPGVPRSPPRLLGLALPAQLSAAWCAAGSDIWHRGARHHRGDLVHRARPGAVSSLTGSYHVGYLVLAQVASRGVSRYGYVGSARGAVPSRSR
jgi:hypothetical protein